MSEIANPANAKQEHDQHPDTLKDEDDTGGKSPGAPPKADLHFEAKPRSRPRSPRWLLCEDGVTRRRDHLVPTLLLRVNSHLKQ